MSRRLLFTVLIAVLASTFSTPPARSEIIDRIAAIVDDQVITTSEIDQLAAIRFLPHLEGESQSDYRTRLLHDVIDQMLRYRDVERFGVEPVSSGAIDARIAEIASRFDSRADFDKALEASGLGIEQLRARVKRRLEVDRHIEERFSPMVFVSLDEIDHYYQEVWLPKRLEQGQSRVPLASVRDQLRATLKAERLKSEVERWTRQLRDRANVDIYGVR